MEWSNRMLRGLVAEGTIRMLAVEVREVAREARRVHGLGPGAARLAAEGAVATALLSAYLKGEERLTLQAQLEQPRAAITGDVGADGAMRLRLTPPDVHGGDDLRGVMLAIKRLGQRELYRGVTEIGGVSLTRALEAHLAQSTQTEVALRLVVDQADDGQVERAVGVLAERLPGGPDHEAPTHEAFRGLAGTIADHDAASLTESLRFGVAGDLIAEVLEERRVFWRCDCSLERVESMLVALGRDELVSMADEDHGAEITCHFCSTAYRVGEDRLRELANLTSR